MKESDGVLAPNIPDEIAPSEPQVPLGNIAASGAAWNVAVTIFSKFVGIASNIVLARLLLPANFGEYYEALIVLGFATLLRDSALGQVLIHHQKKIRDWENAAFWMSILLGFLASAIVLIAAAVIHQRTGDGTIAGLLVIAAITSPLIAAGTVSTAKLQSQLRFKFLAQLGASLNLLSAAASIAMAVSHCGAFSLMVPQVGTAALRAGILIYRAPPRVRLNVDLWRWATLASQGGALLFTAFCWMVVSQGDNLTLSTMFSKDAVGLYANAFNLSTQTISIFTGNIAQVLLPTLTRLADEPRRQANAYLKACRVLAVLGVPLCFLQIFFARPAILLLFGSAWAGSIIPLQILSAGMAFGLVNSFASYLMQAQGRFRLLTVWIASYAALFLILVQIGARVYGVTGVAWSVAAFHCVIGTLGMRVAVKEHGSLGDVVAVFTGPVSCSIVAAIPVLVTMRFAPSIFDSQQIHAVNIVWLALMVCLYGVIYIAGIRYFAPSDFGELRARLVGIVNR
ncbi:MAG: oligosaccharide flippase family protein, partial [Tepidisphaeraceae bacterium]